jgi:cell division protein FtsL
MRHNKDYSPKYSKQKTSKKVFSLSSLSVIGGGGTRYKTIKEDSKRSFPIVEIITIALIAVLLTIIIMSFIKVSQLSTEVQNLQISISSMDKERAKLEGQVNSKYTRKIIKEKSGALGLGNGANSKVYLEKGE